MRSCHDCGVDEGQIHQLGCDMEHCPFCGGQLISCRCVYEKLDIDCSENSFVYIHGLTVGQEEQWLTMLEQKGRVPYIVYPNLCARCGKLWPDMFSVPDQEWQKYIEIGERGKILCQSCYNTIENLIDEKQDTLP